MVIAMDHIPLSLVNTRLETPDPLETPLGVARWWANLQPMMSAAAARDAKPHFDVALAAELRALRRMVSGALTGRTAPQFRFTGSPATDAVLFPIAHATLNLLSSKQAWRIRSCVLTACGRLFIDETKNGSRRWCSLRCMERARAPRRRTIGK